MLVIAVALLELNETYLSCGGRPVVVRLVVKSFELLQICARLLGQPANHCLAAVVPEWQAGQGTLLWWFKQIVHLVIVNLVVAQQHLHRCFAVSILFNFPTAPVDTAQETRDHTSVCKAFTAAHGMCFPGSSNPVGEESDIETIEEVFDGGRHCDKRSVSFPSMLIASLQAKVYQEPTFRVKKLLLHHVGIVHGIEIEGVFLALVFGVGDPHDVIPVSQRGQLSVAILGLSQFGLGGGGRCTGANNDIEFPLGLEKRSDTRNDSDAHDGSSNIHVS